jgi:hypothetical protein
VDPASVSPKLYKPKPTDMNFINVPYESFISDKDEEDTFKQLANLVVHNKGAGYTCFVSAFALFTSDNEVKIHNS